MAKKNQEIVSAEPKSRFDSIIDKFNKSSKEPTFMIIDEKAYNSSVPCISTGIISLDKILGSGLPCGRIIEIFGPNAAGKSTVCAQIVAHAQKLGGICAYVDAENAVDVNYFHRLGVDWGNVLFTQPDSGEQALNIVMNIVPMLNKGDVVVIDSVASLTPQSEINGEIGDSFIGIQARMMGQALRKLVSLVASHNVILIFINQIREKTNVTYGCLHYDTLVNFEDGRSIPIGKVVEEKIEGNVFCFNEETNCVEAKPVLDWFYNGKIENKRDFIHIQTKSITGHGRFGITCTRDHKILTNSGWKKAEEINYNDKLVSKYLSKVNGTFGDFLSGTLVGDSTIARGERRLGAYIRIQDNANRDYMCWKVQKLSSCLKFSKGNNQRGYSYSSEASYELLNIKEKLGNRNPIFFMENYSELGLAVWFMDDVCLDMNNYHCRYRLNLGRFKNSPILNILQQFFIDKGFDCSVMSDGRGNLQFTAEASRLIASKICKYVPDCMQYKLPEEYRGRYEDFILSNNPTTKIELVDIVEIRESSDRQFRNRKKYDLLIEGNHNYFVGGCKNGVVVHNSNETTPGGRALGFAASIRMDIRSIGKIKKGEEIVGTKTKIKIVKNKVFPPFKECEVDLIFGEGISPIRDMLNNAIDLEIVQKAGAWLSYSDKQIGQGIDNSYKYLIDNPEVLSEIELKVREKLGMI